MIFLNNVEDSTKSKAVLQNKHGYRKMNRLIAHTKMDGIYHMKVLEIVCNTYNAVIREY